MLIIPMLHIELCYSSLQVVESFFNIVLTCERGSWPCRIQNGKPSSPRDAESARSTEVFSIMSFYLRRMTWEYQLYCILS